MTAVLVAAATTSVRAGLEALVAERKTLRVVSSAPGLPLAEQVEDARPDVVVIDLPRERLGAALRGLAGLPRPPGIVVLGADARPAVDAGGVRSAGRAVLPRDATAGEVGAAIEAVAAGLVVFHPDAIDPGRALRALAGRPRTDQPLTAREMEILGTITEGLGNKAIATRLGISEHTVKFHVASIFAKLGAGSRTEAVTIGLRRGLLMI